MTTHKHDTKIARLPIFGEDKELAKFLETNFTESLKNMIRVTVNMMVKNEMETFRKEFSEKLSFNGTYGRNMTSSFGNVADIPIPRFRTGQSNVDLKSLSVFDEEQKKFGKLIEQMHLLGISQRKVKQLVSGVFGIRMSTTRVGSIYRELVENESVNINGCPLTDAYRYIYIDGIYITVKGYGWENNKGVILCALGVTATGERKMLGFVLERSEDTAGYVKLLQNIKKRGMTGEATDLFIADDHGAIKEALEKEYPGKQIQVCVAHKMRNVITKTSWKNKQAVADDVKSVFNSKTKEEATEKAKTVVKKWYMTEAKAMESLRFHFEYCLTYFQFPEEIWKKIRTSNILEREFRELRRRFTVFDNTFQSEDSERRYVNSVFNYLNNNYPLRNPLHTDA